LEAAEVEALEKAAKAVPASPGAPFEAWWDWYRIKITVHFIKSQRMCPECSRCVFYTHTKVAIRLVTCVQVCVLSVDWAGECVRNVLDAYFILIRKWRFAW